MAFYLCMVTAMIVMFITRLAAAQTVHVVGDSIGWTVPTAGAQAYANWAAGKTFAVGHILAFNFGTNEHDVLQVPKASFDACISANAVGNVITTGPANVTLDAAGEHYYICTIGRHCAAGQKLAITVSSSTGGNNNNNNNTPPAGTTPQLPNSPPVDSCAPTPSSADPTVVPSANSPPPSTTPAPSSSPALMADHAFLLVVAVAAALLFVSIEQ